MFCSFRYHHRVNAYIADFPTRGSSGLVPEHKLPIPRIVCRSISSVDSKEIDSKGRVNGVVECEISIFHKRCSCKIPSSCLFRKCIVLCFVHFHAVVRVQHNDVVVLFIMFAVVLAVVLVVIFPRVPEFIPREVAVVVHIELFERFFRSKRTLVVIVVCVVVMIIFHPHVASSFTVFLSRVVCVLVR